MPTSGPTISSGRRGYLRYQYGEHFWIPEVLADFSKGMVRDTARIAIPDGSVYDSADYLLHQPGMAQKRGGTSYAGPAMTNATYANSVLYAPFSGGAQLLAGGSGGSASSHLFKITAATTTDLYVTAGVEPMQSNPVFWGGAAKQYAIYPVNFAATPPVVYDGAAAPALLGGSPPQACPYAAIYKSRLVLGGATGNIQRMYFSPVPDISSTWDTANSWIDVDHEIVGFAALNNALLIFGLGQMSRIIGSTPPPNSDMDRAPLANVGCIDGRSIVVRDGYAFFAGAGGVYGSNGTTPVSLTRQGGIDSYWQSLMANFDRASGWRVACGMYRSFLFVTILDASLNLVATLMCNVTTRAWWRLTNIKAAAYGSAFGNQEELYYANADTNRVSRLSGIFNPSAANKADADGTAVTPTIEFRPVGQGTGTKAYAWGHLDYDMRDAAADNPTMAVTVKSGIEADTSYTPPESPLGETSTLVRPRFQINRNAQAVTVALAQSGPSAKTELYALEVQQRQQSLVGEGVS